MDLEWITRRLPGAIKAADAKRKKRNRKQGGAPGVSMIGDRLVRVGDLEVRVLSLLSFRVIHWEIMLKKTYGFETAESRPLIVDCGSNIGLSVLYFKQLYPGARILAFEPDPEAFACLTENVERNRLADVEAYNVALADRDGEISLHTNPSEVGDLLLSVVPTTASGSSRSLPCVRLSNYLEEPVDYLKIDIEGGELNVLEDLEKTGKLELVRRIGAEYHHHLDPEVDELGRFLSILERANFGYRLTPPELGGKFLEEVETLIVDAWRKPAKRDRDS